MPRPVGDIIVASVIPPGTDGRIPIVAVNGRGAAAISLEIGKLLSAQGLFTGVVCAEGTFVDGEQTRRAGNTSRHVSDLLLHPLLEAVVAEVPDEAILNEGLGFDRCQLVVFTGSDPEELTAAKRVLAESVVASGTVILNARQPWAEELTARYRGEVVVCASDSDMQKNAKKWQKTIVFASKNAVFAMFGGLEERIADWDESLTQDELDQRLAVSAAAWVLRRQLKPQDRPQ
jgi:cyanophycin synthetase